MTSPSFARLANVIASTYRNPPIDAEGKSGTPVVEIADLLCTPLDPVDPEIRYRLQIDTPHELLETFVDGDLDIQEGDVLRVDDVDYPIKSVGDWDWRGTTYKHLILEHLKTQ